MPPLIYNFFIISYNKNQVKAPTILKFFIIHCFLKLNFDYLKENFDYFCLINF